MVTRMVDDLEQSLESTQKNAPDEAVDLAELIGKVLEDYSDKIKEQDIAVTIKVEQHVKLYMNESRFRVALSNVIDNAIQFSDDGKKKKFIEVLGHVNFTSCSVNVIDNGIGMERGTESKVFDLFFRGTEQSKGLGIGLHVVREVLEQMGGSVSVHSVYKAGSKFFLWLPNKTIQGTAGAE
jgi:signal transduction histidine kinase